MRECGGGARFGCGSVGILLIVVPDSVALCANLAAGKGNQKGREGKEKGKKPKEGKTKGYALR